MCKFYIEIIYSLVFFYNHLFSLYFLSFITFVIQEVFVSFLIHIFYLERESNPTQCKRANHYTIHIQVPDSI